MDKKKLQTSFSTRQYMISHDFEIYYYNDSPSQMKPVPSHIHDYYEFYFFLQGNVSLYVNDTEYHVNAGDIVLIPPDTPHYPVYHDKVTPYRRFILWISKDYCNHLLQSSLDYGFIMQLVQTTKNYIFTLDIILFNQVQSLIFQIIEEVKGKRFGRQAQIELQINSLLLHLNRIVYEKSHSSYTISEKELYIAITDYINSHLEEELSLHRLEEVFFVSKYYISHTFKDNIGLSLHQYILKKRLQASKNAILSDMSISKTYEKYGFRDYSAFFRAFKKEFGLSPKEYKELHSFGLLD